MPLCWGVLAGSLIEPRTVYSRQIKNVRTKKVKKMDLHPAHTCFAINPERGLPCASVVKEE